MVGFWPKILLPPPQFSSVAQSCRLFATPWTAAHQASLSIQLPEFTQTHVHWGGDASNYLILCHPLSSCLQSFPASGSFPTSQFFTLGGESVGLSASASVLPMNIQDWFPLGWTEWISLKSKELSTVFSKSTLQKHQFFSAQLSL